MYEVTERELEKCGSPIERQFLKAWGETVRPPYESASHAIRIGLTAGHFLALPEVQPFQIVHVEQFDGVIPQASIGRYRVDFLFCRAVYGVEKLPDGTPGREILRRLPMVVVECDGHDFHERTKQQAARDKARDRFLTAEGFRILRFTGSEIHKSPRRCAEELHALFNCLEFPNAVRAAFPEG